MKRQCKKCPWKVGTDPYQIPDGYSRELHCRLRSTVPTDPMAGVYGDLHIMACHETPVGKEQPCVGWLDNQFRNNNMGVRLAVFMGRIDAQYKLDGPQHSNFEATIPEER